MVDSKYKTIKMNLKFVEKKFDKALIRQMHDDGKWFYITYKELV